MLRLVIRTTLALLAATSIAHATETLSVGHLSYVDASAGQLAVDNYVLQMPSGMDAAGFNVGDKVIVTFSDDNGVDAVTTLAEDNMVSGPVTYVNADARQILINNELISVAADVDMSNFQMGDISTVDCASTDGAQVVTHVAGVVAAADPTQTMSTQEAATQTAAGAVSFVDQQSGGLIVNNASSQLGQNADVPGIHAGEEVTASSVMNGTTNIATNVTVSQ